MFDFAEPENNHFLCVRELWVRGDLYRRRADIVGFVNGLPLLFIECKNIHKDLKAAFEQNYSDYLDTIPHLFHHNAVVMFGNGDKAKIGSLTSKWEHFHEWKRLAEDESGVVIYYIDPFGSANGMLDAGVYLAPSAFEAGFVSLAHTDGDIDETLAAARDVMAGLRAAA